jgi:sugar lactone lactonase YvrE
MVDGITISNGIGWSPDASTMYYVDSPTGRVDAWTYDDASGAIRDRRIEIAIPAGQGGPDGITVDAEGGIWVALWDGWAVQRFVAGKLDRTIRVPVRRPTSCTFGGPDLDWLYITSAWKGLSPEERRAQPLAGGLFRVRPGVRGLPPASYAGG